MMRCDFLLRSPQVFTRGFATAKKESKVVIHKFLTATHSNSSRWYQVVHIPSKNWSVVREEGKDRFASKQGFWQLKEATEHEFSLISAEDALSFVHACKKIEKQSRHFFECGLTQ